MCNEHIFQNGSFSELKIAKESNDLVDLGKGLTLSNEFSVNRKCGQNVATDDRRTFSDKDKVRRIQSLGNDNKDAMLDCESGFHQSEDKHKLNCHKLRSSYVTSILITLSAAIFLFVCFISFVAFMHLLYSHVVQACLFRIK